MRLFYFDLTRGNRIGFNIIKEEFGWLEGLRLALAMQLKLLFQNPFHHLNAENPPSQQAKLSQRQMGPVVVLYQLLLEKGLSQQEALGFLRRLSAAVAVEFLKFNVPIVNRDDWQGRSKQEKLGFLKKITRRFFNAEAETTLSENDDFFFKVNRCYFAEYASVLDLKELGPLFCESDRLFFDAYQKDIRFERTQTLAQHQKPCNFSFHWKTD